MADPTPESSRHGGHDAATSDQLEGWIAELATALGVDPGVVDRDMLLRVSRSAHCVTRAAAPFTMFLVGMAVGQGGGGAEAMTQAATTAERLAVAHAPTSGLT